MSGMTSRLTLASALVLMLVNAAFGQDSAGASSSGRLIGSSVGESRFVTVFSRMAGAESVCHPSAVRPMRLCAEFLVAHWHGVTGLPGATETETAVYPVIWSHGLSIGSEVQKRGAGFGCHELDQAVMRSGATGYCPLVAQALAPGR